MNKDLSKSRSPDLSTHEGRELPREERSEAGLRVLDVFENQNGEARLTKGEMGTEG